MEVEIAVKKKNLHQNTSTLHFYHLTTYYSTVFASEVFEKLSTALIYLFLMHYKRKVES